MATEGYGTTEDYYDDDDTECMLLLFNCNTHTHTCLDTTTAATDTKVANGAT
jgi:hypothetical protein